MTGPERERELLEKLEAFGDPRKTWKWREGDPDYVALFDLTNEDVPQLITLARQWVEREDWPDDEDDVTIYAPIHAWRGLGQLGAEEAIDPLLDMIGPLDETDDDWHLEEFPHVFAGIGPAAIPALAAYLADAGRGEFARVCVAHALCCIASRAPDRRDEVVRTLTEELARFADNPETFNGFLVTYLVDLAATESAETIERAYAADRVDVFAVGNWNEARRLLGVEGLGLVPEQLATKRPSPFFQPPREAKESSGGERRDRAADEPKQGDQATDDRKRRKSKRKQQRKARKRGRRR